MGLSYLIFWCPNYPFVRGTRPVAEGTECRQQRRQEDVNPLIRFALNHPEQAPLHDLERIRFQVDQDEQEPIFWCREGQFF